MAMTGGTSVLLKSEIPQGFGSHKVNLYAYYKYTQSIVDNKTTLYCGMYVTTDPGWDIGEWTDHNKSSYIGTTSNTFNGTMPNHDGTYWLTENQKVTVAHNNNGTGSATIYWKWNVYSTWGGYVYPSGYFNVTLPTIPREAKITEASDFKSSDNPPTVKFSNPLGNDATALEICIADSRAWSVYVPYRAITNKTATSYTFTAEDVETLKSKVGSSTDKLDVTFVIRTNISGNSFASSSDVVKFTLVEDETTKPDLSMVVSLNNGSLSSTFADKYIQGKTRLNISLAATGRYGANISSYSANIDGKTYTTAPIVTDAIIGSGNVEVLGYAKDSRGFTGEAKEQITVIPYSKPLVVPLGSENAIQCYRSDGNGVRVGKSTSVWVKAKMTFYSVEQLNGCALQWRSKLVSEAWNDSSHLWKDLIPKTSSETTEYNAMISGAFFDNKKSYTIQIRAIDDIGENDIKTFELPTEDVALHLGKNGKNVTVGTYCDYSKEYTFYSDWEAIFDKGIVGTVENQYAEDIIKFAEDCAVGVTPFMTGASSVNLPSAGNFQYSTGIVHKRSEAQIHIYIANYLSGAIATNTYFEGDGYGWIGWKYFTPQ